MDKEFILALNQEWGGGDTELKEVESLRQVADIEDDCLAVRLSDCLSEDSAAVNIQYCEDGRCVLDAGGGDGDMVGSGIGDE